MADYFALLSRAVASLDHNTKEAREGLYNRARTALRGQLRNADPPWSDADVKSEAAALEAAIRQIEFEIRRSAARSTSQPQTGTQPGPRIASQSGLLGKFQSRQQKRAAPPPTEPEPKSAEDADETPFSLPLSPAALAAIGAIALAIIGAGTYAYVSRSSTRAPAVTAGVDTGTGGSKPAATAPSPTPPAASPAQPGATPPAPKPATPAPAKTADAANSGLPYLFRRQLVYYRSTYPPGTLIINKSQHTLYEVRPNTVALQYSIGIGSSCENVAGLHKVLRKEMWPPFPPGSGGSETPQTASQHRPESKLGARAIYLSDMDYGIHGTTTVSNIGKDSSFGCFMLVDDDVADLYERANVDTRVVITN